MKYIQVGVTALRTPDGGFLPSVPLYIEETEAAKAGQKELLQDASELFADKMKQYIEGGGLRPRAKPGRKPKGA